MFKQVELASSPFFKRLCALPYVDAIWLYGSRARGDADDWSDYDLVIHCPKATTGEWLHIKEIAAGAGLLVKVECTRFDTITDDVFKSQIMKYHKVLYER